MAYADLPSEAEPAVMKWVSPRLALISRLGGHFPAGKCHWREELWHLAWAQSRVGASRLPEGAGDARGMLMLAQGSQTLQTPSTPKSQGVVPASCSCHPLRDICNHQLLSSCQSTRT